MKEQGKENVLRTIASMILVISGTILRVCLQGTLIAKRKDLCKLQDNFSVLDTETKHSKVSKKRRLVLLVCLGFVLNAVLSNLNDLIGMQETVSNESRPGFWAFSIAIKICASLSHISELQALMLYLQLSCNVMKLIQEVCLNSIPPKKVLENTAELMKRLKTTSKFLSWFCLYLTMLFILILVFHVYLFVDLLSSSGTHWLDMISDIGNIVAPTLGLWILNVQSEELQQNLKVLKENIQNSEVDHTNFVEINGKKHNEEYAREIVIKMLDEFNGFDVIGFFNLGKPLLLSIVIKVMEFVFVLISLNLSMK